MLTFLYFSNAFTYIEKAVSNALVGLRAVPVNYGYTGILYGYPYRTNWACGPTFDGRHKYGRIPYWPSQCTTVIQYIRNCTGNKKNYFDSISTRRAVNRITWPIVSHTSAIDDQQRSLHSDCFSTPIMPSGPQSILVKLWKCKCLGKRRLGIDISWM